MKKPIDRRTHKELRAALEQAQAEIERKAENEVALLSGVVEARKRIEQLEAENGRMKKAMGACSQLDYFEFADEGKGNE